MLDNIIIFIIKLLGAMLMSVSLLYWIIYIATEKIFRYSKTWKIILEWKREKTREERQTLKINGEAEDENH